jgi:15-hydroxyprostaglandin dehydrogenase (NAD)
MASSKENRVAVITGACSGIGLALTKDLISRGWRVALGDIESSGGDHLVSLFPIGSSIYVETDVTSWESQSALFRAAHDEWGRIDFHTANICVGDRENIFPRRNTIGGHHQAIQRPDLQALEVDLTAVVYGTYLALHYFRQAPGKGGRIVLTSSLAGLFSLSIAPQYIIAKHAAILIKSQLMGWTKSMAPNLAKEGITINAILPGMMPKSLMAERAPKFPKELMTPLGPVLKAFNMFLENPALNGVCAECSSGDVYFADLPQFSEAADREMMDKRREETVARFDGKRVGKNYVVRSQL